MTALQATSTSAADAVRGSAVLLVAAASLTAADIVGGLLAPHGYVFSLVWLHALLVGGLAAAGVACGAAAWLGRRAGRWVPAVACGVAAAELPWTTSALPDAPWFSWLGIVGAVLAAGSVGLGFFHAAEVRIAGIVEPDPWASLDIRLGGRSAAAHIDTDDAAARPSTRDDASPAAGPSRPGVADAGWYADPDGAGWRWWDGRGWTAHHSDGAR